MGHRLSSSRRELLSTLSGTFAVGLVAGCSGQSDGSDATRTATEGEPSPTATASPTSEASPTPRPELDLREANVVDVAFDAEGDRYTFDVTLHHDDEGEDGYANWWQVERLDGTRLGRRELLHPHTQQPFTRSDSYDLPTDVACVVVRGHDETHGYGGRAMLVDLSSGATRPVDQGRDPDSLTAADCPS
jgi:hypothetical protein